MDSAVEIAEQAAAKAKRRLAAQPAQRAARVAQLRAKIAAGVWMRPASHAWLSRWGGSVDAEEARAKRRDRPASQWDWLLLR